ncbi:MAG: 3-keto-disaccharide hydrolase, partial [Chthoniobacteraceae bacterium]
MAIRPFLLALVFLLGSLHAEPPPPPKNPIPFFDGSTLKGWEGDPKMWRVEDGAITGGSRTEKIAHNDFIATTNDYSNFILRMKIKLTGDPKTGMINSGVQIRSQRVPGSPEMKGYQCDLGDPTWWGCVYDESRRNRVMAQSDMKALDSVIKRNDWNEYVIRAEGPRITTWLNGVQAVDYTEADPDIPLNGKIGIQIHSGGAALVQVKDFTIEVLPETPPNAIFRGAPEPKKAAKASPLTGEEQRASFTLPPGFEIELVAEEEPGVTGKFITVAWDQQGRMWSMTAFDYPVDGNENPAAAT